MKYKQELLTFFDEIYVVMGIKQPKQASIAPKVKLQSVHYPNPYANYGVYGMDMIGGYVDPSSIYPIDYSFY